MPYHQEAHKELYKPAAMRLGLTPGAISSASNLPLALQGAIMQDARQVSPGRLGSVTVTAKIT
jgi:hypothetical protein